MQCKFCLKENKLIDAHILPRCFYENMRDDRNKPFLKLTNIKGEHFQKCWIGFYDSSIICEDCEKIFQKYDDYACRTLLSDFNESNFIFDYSKNKVAYKLNNIEYEKLKLFFLSVLWRASVSERKEFKKVNIGPFEKSLRNMIQNNNPGQVNDFLIITERFNDFFGKEFLMDPYKLRLGGINFYHFYLGAGYGFYIKVDQRNLEVTNDLYKLALKPDNFLYILLRNLLQSKEYSVITKILQSNK